MENGKEIPTSPVEKEEAEQINGSHETASLETANGDQTNVDKEPVESRHLFRKTERAFSFLANLAVVVGVGFALVQIIQSDRAERRRVALEVVSQTRSQEFLKAYRQLKVAYHTKQVKEEDKDALLDSLNYVMNVYDNIAVMYETNLADRCIIRNGIQSGAQEVSEIAAYLSYSPEYRQNFDSLLRLMRQERCTREINPAPQP